MFLQDIKYLKGVGPHRAQLLQDEWGVRTIIDLLEHYPYKYVDRSKIFKIREIVDGLPFIQLRGEILNFETEGEGYKRRLKAVFSDGTGYVDLVWFNGIKYIQSNYKLHTQYVLLGHATLFNGRFSFAHPDLELASNMLPSTLGLQPVYSFSEKMKRSGFTIRLMKEIVESALSVVAGKIEESLSQKIIIENNLMSRANALYAIHLPKNSLEVAKATERLKFDELFFLQLTLLRFSKHQKFSSRGFVFSSIGIQFLHFYDRNLPFQLTDAQKRVMKEIRRDLGSGKQMNRLLQGDVGSGKTIVALMSCLIAIDNGYQACIMAPTEILAEQHYETLKELLEGLDVNVELLTGVVKGKKRKLIFNSLCNGEINILVGTHALLEPNVIFSNLGLVVIDEQHRFGVKQRAQLWKKNVVSPHILVMTATPIPRTLAMTVYGDLDVSVIDQLPPNRKPIKTLHYYQERLDKLYDGVSYELSLGHQVYVVYPLIEESEKMDLKDLEQGFVLWSNKYPNCKVGKVHGKMSSDEKDVVMKEFAAGTIQILVCTTVIEVGVNVPNASIMIIEEAQRFGLAQLHQLRGRVGRGVSQSYCILVTNYQLSEVTRKRMQIMVDTTDGFVIAEEDLKMRGPGDLEGTQQSGIPFDLKISSLAKDGPILEKARAAANSIVETDYDMVLPENVSINKYYASLGDQTINFSKIS